MLCREIMKPNVECLSPRDSVQSAARKMRDTNVGFLAICDDAQKVLGTITDRDIAVRLVSEARPANTALADLMSKEVVACRPDDDLQVAEELMGKHQKSRILCIDPRGKLAGVISLSDIAQHEDSGRIAETMRQVTDREARAPRA